MSDSESNILNKLPSSMPSSMPSSRSNSPSNEEILDSTLEEVMKVKLQNHLTGKVVDIQEMKEQEKKEEMISEIPESMLNSLYVSNSSLESEVINDNELVFETKEDCVDEEDITESDTESDSIDEDNDEDNDENTEDNEDNDENTEDEEEEESDPLDEDDSKRYVVFDNGKPIVIIVNQDKPHNDIPGLIIFMFAVVCGLWLFNNTCKLCTIMDYDKCLFRMP